MEGLLRSDAGGRFGDGVNSSDIGVDLLTTSR